MKNNPKIPKTLLWEYDLDNFDFDKSYKIVIERVLQRGNLDEWKEITSFYTNQQILETIEWSAQLEERDKNFSKLFLNSDFINVQ